MKNKIFVAITLFTVSFTFAQITAPEVDKLVNRTLTAFNVPGIAVAIIKDGKVVLAEGYGVKS
ncbi:MAG: serine hydrolase, partial [Flavobacterium sp.]|nr:serine hydrolase [Flavobacterium sp.]